MLLNFFDEFMHNRNTGKLYAMNPALQVNCLGCIRMIISPDINFEFRITGRAVQKESFMSKFLRHFSKKLLNIINVSTRSFTVHSIHMCEIIA